MNSISALEAGASCVHTTINGVGERSGIASLAEVTMALKVLYEKNLGVKTEMLSSLSRKLSTFTGVTTGEFAPVVGANAFRHKGGTHVAAVLNDTACYEAFSPESVGNTRRLVLGNYSGKNMVRFLNNSLSLELDEIGVQKALNRLKQKKGDLMEFEL